MLRAQFREPAREVQKGEFTSRNEKQLLVAAAKAALCQTRSGELRAVSCDLHQGVLTLRGQVPSYYLKQVAQEVIRAMPCYLGCGRQAGVRREVSHDGRA
jgi:hypothetical protein